MILFCFRYRNGRCPYCRNPILNAVRLFINFEEVAYQNVNTAVNMLEGIRTQINAAINIIQNRDVPTLGPTIGSLQPPRQPQHNEAQSAGTNDRKEQLVLIPMLWQNPRGQTRFHVEVQGGQLLIRVSRRRR